MRRFLYSFLAVLLIVTALAVPASAASGTMTAKPDAAVKNTGETVTFTFAVSGMSGTVQAIDAQLTADDGLTIKTGEVTFGDCKANFDNLDCSPGGKITSLATTRPGETRSSWTLMTVPVTIAPDCALGEKKIQLVITDFGPYIGDNVITGTITGTVKVAHATHDWSAWQDVQGKAPTCTNGGTQTRTCQTPGCGAVEEQTVKALGHDLTAGDFTFENPDAANAHAKIHVTCGRPGCKYYGSGSGIDLTEADAEVAVTRDAKGAACGQPGKVTYTATLTIGGKLTKTGTAAVDTDAALKHAFGKTQVIWSDGETVTGTKKCSLCGKEFTGTGKAATVTDVEATCTAPGESHREATLTFAVTDAPAAWNEADKTEAVTTKDKPDTIPATGHKYDAAKKVRVEKNGAAVYAIDCTRCKDHIEMMCGDMNNDASIDLRDVTALFNTVRGGKTYPVFEEVLDVNADGSVDAQDTTRLFDYVLGSEHTLG